VVHLGVAEDGGPFTEGQVGGDHDAGALVELAQQVEEQGAAGLAEGQVAELVQDHQIHVHQRGTDAPGAALGLLALQRVDQVDGGVEAHPLAVSRDAGHADGGAQMGLAGARAADEDGVVRHVGEGHLGQLLDQRTVHARGVEVEAGEVAVYGELGRAHLIVHRAHRAVLVGL